MSFQVSAPIGFISNVATSRIAGRVAAGTGKLESLTAAQARTLLDVVASADLLSLLSAKADLVNGLIPVSQIPSIAISEYLGEAADETAMLALSGERGDWCSRIDLATTWILAADDSSQLASWVEIRYPAAPVASVNGQTGAVTIDLSGYATEGYVDSAVIGIDLSGYATKESVEAISELLSGVALIEEMVAGDGSTAEVQRLTVTGTGTYDLAGTTLTDTATALAIQNALDSVYSAYETPTVVSINRPGSTYPTGILEGDLLVLSGVRNHTSNPGAGWTHVVDTFYVDVWIRVADGTETGTIPTVSANFNISQLTVLRGVSSYYFITTQLTNLPSGSLQSMSITDDDSLLMRFIDSNEGPTIGTTTGWTRQKDHTWFKTALVNAGTYSDSMTAYDPFGGQMVLMAFTRSTIPAIVVTGDGPFTFTWQSVGSQPLISVTNVDLTLGELATKSYVDLSRMYSTEQYASTASYNYFGFTTIDGLWKVNRFDATTGAKTTAQNSNNGPGTYADLTAAWVDYLTLTYS